MVSCMVGRASGKRVSVVELEKLFIAAQMAHSLWQGQSSPKA
jgi:hypothetical protein